MMDTPRLAELKHGRLKEYLYESAAVTPDESNDWLFLHFLDDLLEGLLAYRVLDGKLTDLDMLIDHKFWVLGIVDGNAYYSVAADRPDDELPDIHQNMRELIRSLPGEVVEGGPLMEQVALFQRDTAVAISAGLNGEDQKTVVVYHSPLFAFEQALGILKDTVRIDDACRSANPDD